MVADQEGFRVFVDLEARVVDERTELAFAEVGPGVTVGGLGDCGAVAVGGRAADLFAGGEAFAGLGEGLDQSQALLLVEDLEHVGLGAAGARLRHGGGPVAVLHREGDPAAGLAVDEPGYGAAEAAQCDGTVRVVRDQLVRALAGAETTPLQP
ncbi:hypothetical protein [Streptomyces sp. NPDC059788]|uniref:hypothetical protein n=1 Tax=Streptomyces sp. NPDC059788 TaxID=3346948 RepID=UPI0036487216